MKRATRRQSRKAQKRKTHRRKTQKRRQRGGDFSPEYPSTVVSYTPKAEPGNPDAVPRIGSLDEFKADIKATGSGEA